MPSRTGNVQRSGGGNRFGPVDYKSFIKRLMRVSKQRERARMQRRRIIERPACTTRVRPQTCNQQTVQEEAKNPIGNASASQSGNNPQAGNEGGASSHQGQLSGQQQLKKGIPVDFIVLKEPKTEEDLWKNLKFLLSRPTGKGRMVQMIIYR